MRDNIIRKKKSKNYNNNTTKYNVSVEIVEVRLKDIVVVESKLFVTATVEKNWVTEIIKSVYALIILGEAETRPKKSVGKMILITSPLFNWEENVNETYRYGLKEAR